MLECRAYLLGEQVVHVGDADAVRQLLASEHKLVEASTVYGKSNKSVKRMLPLKRPQSTTHQ